MQQLGYNYFEQSDLSELIPVGMRKYEKLQEKSCQNINILCYSFTVGEFSKFDFAQVFDKWDQKNESNWQ